MGTYVTLNRIYGFALDSNKEYEEGTIEAYLRKNTELDDEDLEERGALEILVDHLGYGEDKTIEVEYNGESEYEPTYVVGINSKYVGDMWAGPFILNDLAPPGILDGVAYEKIWNLWHDLGYDDDKHNKPMWLLTVSRG